MSQKMKIVIEIVDKVATCLTKKPMVCGNSSYVVDFVFDEEWDKHDVKTAVFKVNGECIKKVFSGNECNIPVMQNTLVATIGVFAGTIDDGTLSTSTPALVKCKPCATDGDSAPPPPQDDVYNQIVDLCNEAVSTAKSVEERANNGEFEGEKGDKGDPTEVSQTTGNSETAVMSQKAVTVELAKKLDSGSQHQSVYGVRADGSQAMIRYDSVDRKYTLMYRNSSGRSQIASPVDEMDIANKKYVDDAIAESVGDIGKVLDDIITLQEGLISGELV